MTPAEMLRVHCAAMGFLAVILKDEVGEHQARRARGIAALIESFCYEAMPDILGTGQNPDHHRDDGDSASIDAAIDRFKAELTAQGDARLPQDRAMLLKFYDLLHQRQMRRQERHFYATGSDAMIANRILDLIDAEIAEG